MNNLTHHTKGTFVVLLGVSGVGKSTIIRHILETSREFVYVKPYMTRPLRDGESEKISISNDEFDVMQTRGDFLVVNKHYGFKYGTPRNSIISIIESGKTPILDYQLSTIENLQNDAYSLLTIYIRPDSIDEWHDRLKQSEQYDESRFELGKDELEKVMSGQINNVDKIVVNKDGDIGKVTDEVLDVIRLKRRSL